MGKTSKVAAVAAGILLAAQSAVAQNASAQEASRIEYSPSGPWTVDYAEDSCSLFRSFTDGQREVWIELRQIAPVGQARLSVGSSHLELTDRSPHISIFPAREPFEQSGNLRQR